MPDKSKTKIRRAPKRAVHNKEEIFRIIDQEFLCHVAFVYNGYPVSIPIMYGRSGDDLYLHGASVSRLVTELEKGLDVCVSIANVSGLVLARSAFHHSLNYESVVIFGKGKLVDENEKMNALKVISDHLIKGRWEEVRPPSIKEMKATKVIKINLEDVSAKVRTGDPVDDKPDYNLGVWAGVVPLNCTYGTPVADGKLKSGIPVPESVRALITPKS